MARQAASKGVARWARQTAPLAQFLSAAMLFEKVVEETQTIFSRALETV